ncbi:MAG: hypothetical protein ACI9H6_000166 [Patiriisocius sp.]|jgi:hypothetical protein
MKNVTNAMNSVIDGVEATVGSVEQAVESHMAPVRKTVFSRFPALFTLLVTFGVAATFLGFERVLTEFAYINDRPVLMLSIGIFVLLGTGTLYKKLG